MNLENLIEICIILVSFKEDGLKVTFKLVIPGLECSRHLTKFFAKYPDVTNAKVLDNIITNDSLNYSIKCQSTMFRFQIERLPTPIKTDLVQIEVI